MAIFPSTPQIRNSPTRDAATFIQDLKCMKQTGSRFSVVAVSLVGEFLICGVEGKIAILPTCEIVVKIHVK